MSFTRVLIFGAGGLGREVLQLTRDLRAEGRGPECVGFLADAAFDPPAAVAGVPVYRDAEVLLQQEDVGLVIAIGDTAQRARLANQLSRRIGRRFATLVHPRAYVGETVQMGEGSMLLALASATADVAIGRHAVINPAVTIAHDCRLGDFVSVGPSTALAGGVSIGDGCDIGVGAAFAPRATVGEWSIVGAGAVVLKDHPANVVVAGVPARIIQTRAAGWHDARLGQ